MKKEETLDKKRINDDLSLYYQRLDKALFNMSNDEFYKYFENAFLNGSRTYYQKNIAETKKFDDTWIKTVESYFPSIDKITRDPRSNLKYEEDIVAIERAKKTSSKSVRHLASHTEFIKEIDENLNVTPKKILIENAEQNYATYENRFIMTLINRLFLFVRNRYEIIKNNVESEQRDHLSGNVNFNFNKTNVEMNFDMTIKKDLDDKSINEHNHDLLNRTEKLNYLISGLKNSKFMQLLSGANPVHPPIMKTNVITKNPEFRNAYNLWIFLDKYSILGYDVTIKEKDLEFDDGFIDDVNKLFAINYATILGNQINRLEKYNEPKGYEELVKKKTKIARQNPKDFVPNPDLIEMEETHLNEYFLQEYKALLDESIRREKEADESEEETDAEIKRALRKTTDIVNGLYDAKFEISEESDVLHRLEEKDLEKEYALALKQLRYAKLIREVKEVDYNNFYRTERRLLRLLSNTNTQMIKKLTEERKYEERERKIKEIEERIEALRKENEERSRLIDALNDHHELMKEEKERLLAERNKVINQVAEELKAYDAMMIAKYEEERKRVLEELQKEKARSQELKAALDEAAKKRKAAIAQMIALEKEKARAEEEEKYKLHKQEMADELASISAVATNYKAKLDKEIASIREANLQNEKENVAIYMVAKYEEEEALREKMRLEEAELAYQKQKEQQAAELAFKEERERLLKEEDERHKAALAAGLEEARNRAQALQEERLEEIETPKEDHEVDLQAEIEKDLIALEQEEALNLEEARRQQEAEEAEQAKLEAIKDEYVKELEKEKFEAERLKIEEDLRKKKELDKKLKDEQMARNAMQREKEAKAISLVEAYEKENQKEKDESIEAQKQNAQENKKQSNQEKFTSKEASIESSLEEQAKIEEKKKKIKENAMQREKESKAISLVEKYESNKNA